jgi:hypothetical protein
MRTDTTYDTATATITTGMSFGASDANRRLGSSAAVIGIFSVAAVIAPTPIAAPAIIGRLPPRWERAIPPAAPIYMLGKMGPPRKLLSEIA